MFDFWNALSSGDKIALVGVVAPLAATGLGTIVKSVWTLTRRKQPIRIGISRGQAQSVRPKFNGFHDLYFVAVCIENVTDAPIRIAKLGIRPQTHPIPFHAQQESENTLHTIDSFLPCTLNAYETFRVQFGAEDLRCLLRVRQIYAEHPDGTRYYATKEAVRQARTDAADADKRNSARSKRPPNAPAPPC